MKPLLLATALAVGLNSVAAMAQTGSAVQAIDIPAGDLARALDRLGEQAGVLITYEPGLVHGMSAPRVSGQLAPREALSRLLEGSGIQVEVVNDKTFVLTYEATPTMQLQPETRHVPATMQSVTELAGIVVTAQRRTERLADVPISIAVVSGADLDQRGVRGMEDYLRAIPGVAQVDTGSLTNGIVIRGITTTPEFENSANGAGATVASYFGETPITGAAGPGGGNIDVRTVDIERIEVLRGPQGTTFGDASLGGAVRIIPNAPELDAVSSRVTASYSKTSRFGDDNAMIQGVVNLPIVRNQLAVRLVGYTFTDSGFYRNIAGIDPSTIAVSETFGLGSFVSGPVQADIGRMRTIGGRTAILWEPGDNTSISMNLLSQKIEQDGRPAADVGPYDQIRTPIAPQARVRGEAGEIADTRLNLANLVITHSVGWADLTLSTSHVDGKLANTASIGNLIAFFGPSSTTAHGDYEGWSGELRLATTFEGPFNFLAGGYAERIEEGYTNTFDWPGSAEANPFGTDPIFMIDLGRRRKQIAAFSELTFDITDRLEARAGGRYFSYSRTDVTLQEGGLVATPIGAGVPTNDRSEDDGTSFNTKLSYRPSESSILYFSWAQGFRLGRPQQGLVPFASQCDQDGDGVIDGTNTSIASTQSIASDSLDSFEIGTKFPLTRWISADASVYRIKWEGLPVQTTAPPPPTSCGLSYTANAGNAVSEGVEFQLNIRPAAGFTLDLGASYVNARLKQDAPGLGASRGDRLPGAPRFNANLAAAYNFDLGENQGFVRADFLYVGSFYGGFLPTTQTRAGNYTKLDLMAGMSIGAFDIQLFVQNVTNKDAFTWRGTFDQGAFFGYRMRPRTIGIQVGYRM